MAPFSILIISILASGFSILTAQQASLQETVQSVIQKYQNADALKLDFEFQITYPEEKPQLFNGTFYKLNQSYKVDMKEYAIYSDGKSQFTVHKSAKEVQITSVDSVSTELASPAGILKYLQNQDFKYFDKSALNQSSQSLRIVELIPTDKDSDYFKIRFSFTASGKLVKYIEIFAKDGQRIQLTVGDTSFSGNFSQKTVEWNPEQYKDFYIEDLRID